MDKNRKHLIYLPGGILTVLFLMISYSSCGRDTITNNIVNQTLFGGYDEGEAGVAMTLAALSYTAENNSHIMEIRDSLILQLSDSGYTTRGKWKLAWGPGISPGRGNMMYAAVDSTSDTIYFAIAVRGTDWNFPSNIQEDMEIWTLRKYPYGGTGDSVATGSLYGLDTLLSTTDPISGQSLQTFLNGIPSGHLKMYITGHSLGGALATLVTAWFVDMGYTSKFALETYTFAAPTVGNESFATRYNNILVAANAQSHRVVNTKDLVPYAWAGVGNIVRDNIPTAVPFDIAITIGFINAYLDSAGIKYKHVESRQPLGYLVPSNCSGGSEDENYFCWVAFEHESNNYLRLLHADTVKIR